MREPQHQPERDATPEAARAPGGAAAPANRALARALAGNGLSNRAMHALISREEEVYGPPAPSTAMEGYEFSDDPLEAGGFGPDDATIRVKPGPVRTTLIRPKAGPPGPQGEWLEEALKKDKLLKTLPDWARKQAIDGLKDIDETIAEKIIDALPWDSGVKEAATQALKALLQTAKGKKFKTPESHPATRVPDWSKQPDFQAAPGQVIIPLPAIKW